MSQQPDLPVSVLRETDEWVGADADNVNLASMLVQGLPEDFVKASDFHAAALQCGMQISGAKLGKAVHRHFGVQSSVKKMEGRAVRGYRGLRFRSACAIHSKDDSSSPETSC